MKNIINEIPKTILNERPLFCSKFVDQQDINGKNILDIGCGYGWFEKNALLNGVKQICGMEISYEDLITAKTYVKNNRCIFIASSAIKLPFTECSFDTVVCWDVIEHLPPNTESLMYSEISRVLKPGGVFYLSTPLNTIISTVTDPAWWLIDHRHYSLDKLKELGASHNMQITRSKRFGKFWFLLSQTNMYISKWIFHRNMFFENIIKQNVDKEIFTDGFMGIAVKYQK